MFFGYRSVLLGDDASEYLNEVLGATPLNVVVWSSCFEERKDLGALVVRTEEGWASIEPMTL